MTTPPEFHDARIMVVDDEASNVLLLAETLAQAGYTRVKAITESSLAIELFTSFRPDLVLLDLHMPDPDGFAVMEQLRRLVGSETFVPILVLTADINMSTRERALAGGATDFLSKPFHLFELVLRVGILLHTRQLHLQLARHAASMEAQLEESTRATRAGMARRRDISRRTRRVIDGEGLAMVFQPVIELDTGRVVGAEALSRFSAEPLMPPDRWFLDAGAVGLGVQLEMTAVALALGALDHLDDDAFLSVNASADTLRSSAFHRLIEGVAPERLVIELTEHDVIADYGLLDDALALLRRRGLRLAVDDAGAGFASLRHILRLAPEVIKLDRELITGVHHDAARRALVSSLVGFSEGLGSMLIAEGIEDQAELDCLQELGVGCGQGYLLGRPASLSQLVRA